MKKLLQLAALLSTVFLLTIQLADGQADITSHTTGNTAYYLGWDNTVTFPLNIEHNNPNNPQPINFYTGGNGAANLRMTIMGTNNIGGFGGNNTGWVGIGNTAPLSRLHIGQKCIPPNGGWRNWMVEGTFVCDSDDNVFFGEKYEAHDRADAVIVWGDNDGSIANQTADNLRFIFASSTSANQVGNVLNGQEVMRIIPYNSTTGGAG